MKKNKIFYSVATAAATLVMTAAPMVSTFAAAGDPISQTGTSHATFTVDPTKSDVKVPDTDKPDTTKTGDGALQLVAVPGFDFGSIGTTDLITGKKGIATFSSIATGATDATSTAKTADKAEADTPDTANPDQHLTVSDLRGTNVGWKLSASMTSFLKDGATAGDTTGTINGTLNLKGDADKLATDYTGYDSSLQTLTGFSTLSVAIPTTGAATTIYDAAAPAGAGINVANTSDSTLDLDAAPSATAGHYAATITWTLSSVSDGQAAN
jgi:hypothetical protein